MLPYELYCVTQRGVSSALIICKINIRNLIHNSIIRIQHIHKHSLHKVESTPLSTKTEHFNLHKNEIYGWTGILGCISFSQVDSKLATGCMFVYLWSEVVFTGLGPLVLIMRNVHAAVNNDILTVCIQLCGNSLREEPLLFQHDNAPV